MDGTRRLLTYLAMLLLAPSVLPGIDVVTEARAEEAAKAETVRPEVGKPLQAAQELLKGRKAGEALARIAEADAVAGKTAFEAYLIERLRAPAAIQAGDKDAANKSVEIVLASGRLSATERQKMQEAMAGMYYRANDYAQAVAWAQRYSREGAASPQMRTLLIQSLYLNNEFDVAAREIQIDLQADDRSGRAPAEDRLQLLGSCYLKLNDAQNYIRTLERMVSLYPKKEYWLELISRIEKKPGFAERLALDVSRLKLSTGNFAGANDYIVMGQLALQAGFPAEARKVIEQGFAKGVLGVGADAGRHKRLLDMALKDAAEDQKTLAQTEAAATAAREGNALVGTGFNYVVLGQFDKGLALMEQGIRKAGLKRPEDAALHLGVAYLMAGQKVRARQVLQSVQGSDGAADLARLWIVASQRSL